MIVSASTKKKVLLINSIIVIQPSILVHSIRIMMRPMDHSAFIVPLVFTVKLHGVIY